MLLPMERRIVHYQNFAASKRWTSNPLKPRLKQFTVHRTVVLHRLYDFPAAQRCGYANSFISASADFFVYNTPSARPRIGSVYITVDTGFVDIYKFIWRYGAYLFVIFRCFLLILFFVWGFLFFAYNRDVLMPCRQPPLNMRKSLSFQINKRQASGCSSRYFVSFWGSIFLKYFLRGLGVKFPCSANRFFHRHRAVLLTL